MLSPDRYVIPLGSWILVTGSNGYIGSQVVDTLLKLGYNVRGTVRMERPWLHEFFKSKHGPGRFESVVIPRLEDDDSLNTCMQDISGIVHVASDMTMASDPNKVIPPVVSATLNVMKAAQQAGTVKRVVLTSSMCAVGFPKFNGEVVTFDTEKWNDEAVKAAWDENSPAELMPMIVYGASKAEGERAAWNWVKENKPNFSFNSVLPNVNFGRILHPEIGGTMMKITRDLLDGNTLVMNIPPQWRIDVEDDARLHAAALLDPDVVSERIFGVASPFNWTDVIGILQKLRPNNKKIPDPPENEPRDLTNMAPAKRAEELLQSFFGKGWTGIEESLAAGIAGHE
ncbi:uncharacterized protein CIMG_09368 [Coccidioides immitis RS]|uniref:NAD-dependent epimerase/dehydratase domain-containing protein n=1 Tax=Coccidioides immitis (strain RS) TaxID=246410 RepID=A0A0E1RUR9_COCIM|nr:uncharacterized protein CIMG_09368 [Coccidioides immitis RS]EAS28164.2 hypothetical protein CIMG_09368 [Coccidioides immitis RS]TPX20823.1 hypothetical protein DIZ76_016719 [Coccidioides immitis]